MIIRSPKIYPQKNVKDDESSKFDSVFIALLGKIEVHCKADDNHTPSNESPPTLGAGWIVAEISKLDIPRD